MNVARCVELHNEIVRLGWEGLGNSPEDYQPQTWFQKHGQRAEQARPRLSPDLIAFLEGAHDVPRGQFFHYYAGALLVPKDDMFAFLDSFFEPDGEALEGVQGAGRYIRLYFANSLISHPEGLIFDKEDNVAIMSMGIGNQVGLGKPDRLYWHPLEHILAAWLDMIQTGKVKAVGTYTDYPPWELVSYTEHQVDEAVEVFNALVSAIEARMPHGDSSSSPESRSLLDVEDLAAAHIPTGFAHDFLTRARRPRFRFIAPGLSLPTPSTIADQPFFGVPETVPEEHRSWISSPPILLFRSSRTYNAVPYNINGNIENVSEYPYNKLPSYPAGLYFGACSDEDNNAHDDAVVLVLPYAIGANGWARKTDGTRFGEDLWKDEENSADRHMELYQTGHQPFIKRHDPRLVHVLGSWLEMVEYGDWQVGPEGIMNDMDEWKKADTEDEWQKYTLTPQW